LSIKHYSSQMEHYKWSDFASKKYSEQAKAFLNAYWDEAGDRAEDVWNWCAKFVELDLDKAEEGCDLDEFGAHRFLEAIAETKTVKEMRVQLKETDLDFNKRIALLEYCLWKFGKRINDFLSKPQGDAEEVKKCAELLESVQAALKEAISAADSARKADNEASSTAREAKARDEAAKISKEAAEKSAIEAKAKEDVASSKAAEAKAAADELRAALADLHALEKAYSDKTELLKKKSEEGGVVTRNKAKAELAQHLAEDPLPLRTAKITTEAATRKAEKAQKEADESHAAAKCQREEADKDHAAAVKDAADAASARAEAEAAAEAAAVAREAADSSLDECQRKYAEAEAALEEAKKHAGPGKGNVWWLERQLHEAKKYMPMKKGGIAKK